MNDSSSDIALKNHVLTVNDVAEILKVCPRTVLNMAKKGEIPASRIGHLWRFEEEEIHHWLRQKSEPLKTSKTRVFSGELPPSLMEMITPDHIRFEKIAMDRREVLEDLASLAVRSGIFSDYSQLLSSLEKRENMFSTALDVGVAFPHPRHPLPGLEKPILAVLIVESGVDFGASEGGKTHVFILFCAPDDAAHVRILARLARTFYKQKRLVCRLKHISQPEKILEELIRAEKENCNFVHSNSRKGVENNV